MAAPLSGIRILDLSELLPGPYATQVLADLGADVLKVERPQGDSARTMLPGLFAAVNRRKRSLVLDLKTEKGRTQLHRLAKAADVLVEGFRPGVTARLGVDYGTLSALNPALIYVSLSGYGATGPYAALPGHDLNYLAIAGVLGVSTLPGHKPEHRFGLPVGDLAGSLFTVTSILAALLQRARDGKGQFLDMAITDGLAHFMTLRLGQVLSRPEDGVAAVLNRPAYGIFATADDRYLALAALEDHFWASLVRVMGLTELAGPAYAGYAERVAAYDAIQDAVARAFRTQDAAHWLKVFHEADVPCTEVAPPTAAFTHPQLSSRGVAEAHGSAVTARFPVAMRDLPPIGGAAPALGVSTAADPIEQIWTQPTKPTPGALPAVAD